MNIDVTKWDWFNSKLTMIFICKGEELISKVYSEVYKELSRLTPTTYLKCRSGWSCEDDDPHVELKRKIKYGIETWFGRYLFYGFEGETPDLLGFRRDVVVLDDSLCLSKDYYMDIIEPIASERGSIILLSEFMRNLEPTKYTKPMEYFLVEPHEKLVRETIIEERE